jgi:hypothetical protein
MPKKPAKGSLYDEAQVRRREELRRETLRALDKAMLALGKFDSVLRPVGVRFDSISVHCSALETHINAVHQDLLVLDVGFEEA